MLEMIDERQPVIITDSCKELGTILRFAGRHRTLDAGLLSCDLLGFAEQGRHGIEYLGRKARQVQQVKRSKKKKKKTKGGKEMNN